eukprot:338261-Amphidinium_carterae.1
MGALAALNRMEPKLEASELSSVCANKLAHIMDTCALREPTKTHHALPLRIAFWGCEVRAPTGCRDSKTDNRGMKTFI